MYQVVPNFLRQREQKIGGLFTPVQLLAGLVAGVIPAVIVTQISFWLLIPLAVGDMLLVIALAPREGGFLFYRWLFPLRAEVMANRLTRGRAFAELGRPATAATPLVWTRSGDLAVAARIEQAPPKRKG